MQMVKRAHKGFRLHFVFTWQLEVILADRHFRETVYYLLRFIFDLKVSSEILPDEEHNGEKRK